MPPEDLSSVRRGYDRWSLIYDHDANPLTALEEPHMQGAAGDVRGLAVLDLGCGTGRHASWLAAAGAKVTAVDFSEGMLAEARQKPGAPSITFLRHDIRTGLPFADGQFDLLISGLVLEHIQDLTSFFTEGRRVVRDDGRAVISAMHPAMFLRGNKARFTDPESGQIVMPGSVDHKFGDIVTSVLRAGFDLDAVDEYTPDAAFAARYPRAEKYIGWPMLLVLTMRACSAKRSTPL